MGSSAKDAMAAKFWRLNPLTAIYGSRPPESPLPGANRPDSQSCKSWEFGQSSARARSLSDHESYFFSQSFSQLGSAVSVLVIQRAFAHGRAFLAWSNLTRAALSPLAQAGKIVAQMHYH